MLLRIKLAQKQKATLADQPTPILLPVADAAHGPTGERSHTLLMSHGSKVTTGLQIHAIFTP